MAIQELQGHQIASIAVDPLIQQIKCRAVPGATVDTGIPQLTSLQVEASVLVAAAAGCEYGDPFFDNVILLMHGEGANGSTTFTDLSNYEHTFTNSTDPSYDDARISTTQSKFGSSSISLDVNDIIEGPNTEALFTLNGDFTIEFWVYLTGTVVDLSTIYLEGTGSNENVICLTGNTKFKLNYGDKVAESPSVSSVANTWAFYTAVRSGTDIMVAINGQFGTPVTVNTIPANPGVREINTLVGSSVVASYLDEIRITKGAARYTSNFIPPTEAFLDY